MFKKVFSLIIIVAVVGVLFYIIQSDDIDIGSRLNLDQSNQTPQSDQSADTANGTQPASADDFGPVGSLSHEYLQNSPFSQLVVEIDYAEGNSPSDTARAELENKLKKYTDKSDGVVFSGSNAFPAPKNKYTSQDLANLMKQNRQHYTEGKTVSLYVLFLNGSYENTNSIGVAFFSSAFAIFQDQVEQSSGILTPTTDIEGAVTVHELGHLWGLVNLNYQSEIDHEDPEHPNHSNNRGSVMYWAVESSDISTVLGSDIPDDFDQADRADIEKIKAGEY